MSLHRLSFAASFASLLVLSVALLSCGGKTGTSSSGGPSPGPGPGSSPALTVTISDPVVRASPFSGTALLSKHRAPALS